MARPALKVMNDEGPEWDMMGCTGWVTLASKKERDLSSKGFIF
jgi:hypothetical protein